MSRDFGCSQSWSAFSGPVRGAPSCTPWDFNLVPADFTRPRHSGALILHAANNRAATEIVAMTVCYFPNFRPTTGSRLLGHRRPPSAPSPFQPVATWMKDTGNAPHLLFGNATSVRTLERAPRVCGTGNCQGVGMSRVCAGALNAPGLHSYPMGIGRRASSALTLPKRRGPWQKSTMTRR